MRFSQKAGLVLVAIALLGAGLLAIFMARGFRANSEPSRVEVVVARAIRN
jgi:hypothetical protein